MLRSITNNWRIFPTLGKWVIATFRQRWAKVTEISQKQNWHASCKAIGNRQTTEQQIKISEEDMTKLDIIGRNAAALALTILASATMLIAAVGPANQGNAVQATAIDRSIA
ncbi:hypothetical protein ACM61V_10685 [Sphingomonas sp. TX0543]|uniref:hypothetical protein n=1 Tax=unclassified Sphingomonas TaxID=196159 RepID=UPI0010F4CEF6|nr:hypothetical protein [Sphingomonas sp. 3P27F8]